MFLNDLEDNPNTQLSEISKTAPAIIFADNTAAIKYISCQDAQLFQKDTEIPTIRGWISGASAYHSHVRLRTSVVMTGRDRFYISRPVPAGC